MLLSIAPSWVKNIETTIDHSHGIPGYTQRRIKSELRKMFGLSKRSPLTPLKDHPQIRQAIEYLIVREERADKNSLRSAKGLSVIVPSTGEQISIEDFLKSLYPREGVNASSCYRALVARCINRGVVHDDLSPASQSELPNERTVTRFLQKLREEHVAIRRGRSRKHDWEVGQESFITRDVTQLRPGEVWIGDHTELDFMVLNEEGKLDRRWITAFIDMRTSLVVGYNLNWQPSSKTIALAFRSGVLGLDVRAWGNHGWYDPKFQNVPEVVMLDNGKDYRSKYTQQIFGKVEFADAARLSIQRLTKLHYVKPYHGQSKAQMERWFRTIQTMLKYLPGFKGNHYQNKPDSLKEDVKKGKILPVEQFDTIVAEAINTYNNRIHRTHKGLSPLQCYLTNQTHQRTIDSRVLDFLLMKADNKPIRKCQVRLMGHDYYSDQLLKFNGRHADVYYDPQDPAFVSIYVNGELAAVATNKDATSEDRHAWRKHLAERHANEKSMQVQLKDLRGSITDDDAREMLHQGELLNLSPVSEELVGRLVPTITQITGIEQQAKERSEEIEKEKELVEIEQKAKRRAKNSPAINLGNISNVG